MPLACFGQMDSLEYRLRSHIRTSLRTFYILKIVLLPRNPWQHIAYLKLNQPKIKATKFPQKIVCGNATDTALYISANGNAAETLRKRETRPHFALTCFRPPEMWRKLEPSDFRKISEIRKRLISPCENFCGMGFLSRQNFCRTSFDGLQNFYGMSFYRLQNFWGMGFYSPQNLLRHARNCEKLESLNKWALRIVLIDEVSSYQQLLHISGGATLYNWRIQNMLITIDKCLNYESFPKYLCVSLYTFLEELILYHCVNLLLLLMASTIFVTLHRRNGTPYLIMWDLSLLYLVLKDSWKQSPFRHNGIFNIFHVCK